MTDADLDLLQERHKPRRWAEPISLAERLERRSEYDPNSGCVLWSGYGTKQGYGVISIDGKTQLTHRVSFELNKGPIPDGLLVLHSCDTPACINPSHLRIGAVKDNTADMISRGRQKFGPGRRFERGERGARARLTEEQVLTIEKDGRSAKCIASEYGIGESTVRHIKNHNNWKHLWTARAAHTGEGDG